jgi:DNA-binding transcriptional ArsR family regulator
LDAVLAAIADPTRRAIINRLARGSARLSDVAQRFPMSLTGFIKHVRVLESAGLVSRKKEGRENTLALNAAEIVNRVGAIAVKSLVFRR